MKLFVLLSSIIAGLLFSLEVRAHCCWTKDNPGFYDLRVELKNVGAENCDLESYDIQKGALYGSNIPTFLPATGDVFYLTFSGAEIDVILTYRCGIQKSISLFMKQHVKKNHKHTSVEAYALNAVDVFEKHTTTVSELGCCSTHDRYSLVTWELSN